MHDGADGPLHQGRSFAPPGAAAVEDRANRRPVFLHGMWRSGSTWLWSRFRAAPETCCFYEPLHHGLAKLTSDRIARDTPDRIDANRHPVLAQPYFHEYRPLIERRGVRGFDGRLAYDRFVLRPADEHPALARYIAGLIDHAAVEGRRAVLGFNRTGLRVDWLQARFDALHIHIERDPMSIWASYEGEAAKGNYAFFQMWLTVLERNAADPLFAPLVERLKLSAPRLVLGSAKARRRAAVEAMSEADRYLLVHAVWLACSHHAAAACDLVIDTRRADSPLYRRTLADQVAVAAGMVIDLEGLRAAPPRTPPLSARLRADVEREARSLLPLAALPNTHCSASIKREKPVPASASARLAWRGATAWAAPRLKLDAGLAQARVSLR